MVKATPQPPAADAAAFPSAMQDSAGQTATDHGQDGKTVDRQKSTTTLEVITRRDVHTASSVNAQRRMPKGGAKEQKPVYEPANRHVKSQEAAKNAQPKSQTNANSKPVLVRGPSTKPDMKKKRQLTTTKSTSPPIPPLESFSIHDILDSIGPDADASIDAIAEICGRSKMSLAAEHSSHRPPQGHLATAGGGSTSSPDHFFLPARLEPVAETSSDRPQTRSMSKKSLALATATGHGQHGFLPSGSTAATSNVTSHTHTTTSTSDRAATAGEEATSTTGGSLLPQVLAWLRRSGSLAVSEQQQPGAAAAPASVQDVGAVTAMHRLLDDAAEAHS